MNDAREHFREDMAAWSAEIDNPRPWIADIQHAVAGFYEMELIDMTSERRSPVVAHPRQVAMYLSKKLTTRSLPEIGRKFGGRDHSTVIYAVRRVEARLADAADDLSYEMPRLLAAVEARRSARLIRTGEIQEPRRAA